VDLADELVARMVKEQGLRRLSTSDGRARLAT
jgi:hypothetical protein